MTIAVDVYGKGMDVTQRVEEYAIEKATRLDKYLPDLNKARVDLQHATTARNAQDRYIAQITVTGKNILLRSEERADDLRVAFDLALEKIRRQISRYKGKRYNKRGDGKTLGEIMPAESDFEDDDDESNVIVKRKKFSVSPMDAQEALEQMKLLGHDNFFIFYNFETESMSVLYRRRDGHYGLIEPELE